jgi:hypothetical protein
VSFPETVQFHKITVREFHALYPYLDPNRPHELLDGQILLLANSYKKRAGRPANQHVPAPFVA